MPAFSAEMTRVTLEITPAGTGCELTLTHEGVLPDYRERTTGGWTKILGGVEQTIDAEEAAAGKQIGPRTLRFEREFPGPIERVWEYLADSEKRGLWPASGELPTTVGAEFTVLRTRYALAVLGAAAGEVCGLTGEGRVETPAASL